MSKQSRHHHYISQCYLRGFTKGGGKKSKLTVIDFEARKKFESNTRNVGGIRDFNRIDVEGIAPDQLENSLAQFEGEAASALRNIEKFQTFEGSDKEIILNLISMFAVRTPEMRENFRAFEAQVMEQIMDVALATKERWESQIERMRKAGGEINEDVTYESIKDFHDRKQYTINFAREHHMHLELVGIDAILPALFERNWVLIKATEDSGPFVTTDNPVNLTWNNPENIPVMFRESPGFGMRDTRVYFPISKNLAIVGEFDGKENVIEGDRQLISLLNSRLIMFAYKQVFAPKLDFFIIDDEGKVVDGRYLLRKVKGL